MPWHASPDVWSAPNTYAPDTNDGKDNCLMINGILNSWGYNLKAQASMIACMFGEGFLNPWQWGAGQEPDFSDPDPNQGYGLFQITPFYNYVGNPSATGLTGYAPNLSTLVQTQGASPSDGHAQMLFYDSFPDWFYPVWRSYWTTDPSQSDYPMTPEQWSRATALYNQLVAQYGDEDDFVHKDDYGSIDSIELAVFCFIACWEGPSNPMWYYDDAVTWAYYIYDNILDPDHPIDPPTPPQPTGRRRKMPLWMYLRRY